MVHVNLSIEDSIKDMKDAISKKHPSITWDKIVKMAVQNLYEKHCVEKESEQK